MDVAIASTPPFPPGPEDWAGVRPGGGRDVLGSSSRIAALHDSRDDGSVMTEEPTTSDPSEKAVGPSRLLGLLLAMAMFVLVVDTSLMNVSISSVVRDLDTTVSGVQAAIALEALVSAAFILIGGKVGDLIGRKRAYVLGLLGTQSVRRRWRSRRA